jgi:hypothetical protein
VSGRAVSTRRRLAAEAWRFRFQVEREAHVRFGRLAGRLAGIGVSGVLQALALRASDDEWRHATRCAERCVLEGGTVAGLPSPAAPEIAASALTPRQRVLYEVVAACCVTESGSMGVLSALLGAARGRGLRRVLRELAADEVGHARLGWAVLAAERGGEDARVLGPFVPAMLEANAGPALYAPAPPEEEDEALLEHGVLPRALRRAVFEDTLEAVVFPGLDTCGVGAEAGRTWLAGKRAGLAPAAAAGADARPAH